MKPLTDAQLTALILGDVTPEEGTEIEAHIAADPQIEARVGQLEDALSALALALEPAPAPSPQLRARLMASAQHDKMTTFAGKLAGLCDIGVDKARNILDLTLGWAGWEQLADGIRFLDIDGGPALAGARPGLVRVEPGLTFPLHTHIGDEATLYLQGTVRYDDGTTAQAGDLHHQADGSAHAFTVTSKEPLIYAVVLGEIAFIDLNEA